MIKLINLIIIITIITGGYFFYNYSEFTTKELVSEEKIITIDKGDTPLVLSEKLDIDNTMLKLYLKNNPIGEFQAGDYRISSGATIDEIVNNLKKAINKGDIKLTFLEGWNIFDIDEYLVNKGLIKKGEFIKLGKCGDKFKDEDEYCKNLKEKYNFLEKAISLEGFLYPDTYNVNPNTFSSDIMINKMLSNFEIKAYNKLLEGKTNKEILDIVNMASIVEKEEKIKENKPVVAGILLKRLDEGWKMGADITVCYPYELTSEECKLVVSKYILVKSLYNTRSITGLPQTPIGNPSIETINAVVFPENTPYYYYLHDKTGQIHYGKNNDEHISNKNKYLR